METRIRHWRELLRTNLWFVPMLLVLAALALVSFSLELDRWLHERGIQLRFLFNGGPEGASAVMSAIAGSMIGVTGVTFSITVVALSLASTQFGPRMLRSFIRDRVNQVVLGIFIGTFTFSLLGLRAVDGFGGGEDAVPEVTVNVAVVLALLSLAVLIYFVHHVATNIQADAVVASVARDLHATIEELYPASLGEEPMHAERHALPESFHEEAVPVRAPANGYVQAIEVEAILKAVTELDLVLRLDVRPGDFVVQGSVLAWSWPRARSDKAALERLRGTFLLGRKPTAEQDVEFSLRQLVEVAVRSLSPGINDPFTAVRALDRLGAALCHLSSREIPSRYRLDEEGTLRVVARTTTWPGAVDAAFDQVRQNGLRSVAVTIRLLEVIGRVADCIPRGDWRLEALARQARMTYRGACAADFDEEDLADVKRRYERLERQFS